MYRIALALFLFVSCDLSAQLRKIPVPTISGAWRPIASNPDLGKYNSPDQEPVDFGVWKANYGTWQLWSCIRKSKFPGTTYTTRFFYGWEGKDLTSTGWTPKGVTWVADSTVGETPGGLQAPYVFKEGDIYYLFYGDWNRICLAKSSDGKNFQRVPGEDGEPDLFSEFDDVPYGKNARDPMILKRGKTFYCYYTAHLREPGEDGGAFCRISFDLKNWSESSIISRTAPYKGNSQRWSDECPFVVFLPEYKLYYLFVTQMYGKDSQTTVYASPNPMYFGVDDEQHKVCTLPIAAPEIVFENGRYYLFALNPGLDGIRMAELKWIR
jgi:hypothetical protein